MYNDPEVREREIRNLSETLPFLPMKFFLSCVVQNCFQVLN
jgi:hypothetical protein